MKHADDILKVTYGGEVGFMYRSEYNELCLTMSTGDYNTHGAERVTNPTENQSAEARFRRFMKENED